MVNKRPEEWVRPVFKSDPCSQNETMVLVVGWGGFVTILFHLEFERKAWFVFSLAWGGAVAHVWEVEEKGLESVYRSPSHSLS